MKRETLSIAFALLISTFAMAEAPKGYYDGANGKKGEALRQALHLIIDNHKVVAYDNLDYLYVATDSHEDGSLWDMYSTCQWQHLQKTCGNYKTVCDCYNKEHSVPQSWFSKRSPMKSDAFHVLPTDGKVNGQRSNYPYGECNGGSTVGSKALGRLGTSTFPGCNSKVFEPADEYKGDLARGYFYMATRYAGTCESWGHETFSSRNSGLTDYAVALFLKWHREDPVSEKERVRNDAIYGINNNTGYKQGNRNPFIDYPCLVEYIWGDKKNENVDLSKLMSSYDEQFINGTDHSGCNCKPTQPTIIYPGAETTVNLGGASLNKTVYADIDIAGVLLTKDITLSINGTNAAMFGLSANKITAAEGLKGTKIRVEYTPNTIGNHTATLNISSTEFATVKVYLKGNCLTTLVSPTETGLTFNAAGIDEPEEVQVKILATNVSNDINLSITGTHANRFTLSTNKVKAKDAENGKFITITYRPNEIGKHTANLIVESADFAKRTIPLNGYTTFEALPATNVTRNAFTANWGNAGAASYTLDVYTKEIVESTEKVLVDAQSVSIEELANFTCLRVEGKKYNENDGLRLGAGSGEGSIIVTGDFSAGGTAIINAKAYHDDKSTLKVYGDEAKAVEKTLNKDFVAYTFTIEPTKFGSITITQGVPGERIIIKSIKVTAGKEKVETNTSINGYPKNVGNVTEYIVNGLTAETDYYYSVTPTNDSKSNEIHVFTSESFTNNEMTYEEGNDLIYYNQFGTTTFTNLQQGGRLDVYNAVGQHITSIENVAGSETLTLENGVYVVSHNGRISKIIVK